jgi:hypothetical protein
MQAEHRIAGDLSFLMTVALKGKDLQRTTLLEHSTFKMGSLGTPRHISPLSKIDKKSFYS